MTTDFIFYQGDDIIPYFVIMDGTEPADLSAWSAATWVATPLTSTTPIITKHKSDMELSTDPDDVGATIENTIFVPIEPEDTGLLADVGTFRHELRITLNGMEAVVYPSVGATATFNVVLSLTWDPGTTPPAPRLVEIDSALTPKPKTKLRRVPQLPKTKLPRDG